MSAKVEVPFSGLTNAEMFAEPAPQVAAIAAAPAAEPVIESVADPKAKPKKAPAKPRAKKLVKSEETVTEGAEDAEPVEPTTPKAPAKRGRASKKNVTPGPTTPGAAEGDEMVVDTPVKTPVNKTPKKRATPAKAEGETPAKKAKPAPKGSFPTCWDDFSEEDKLIVTMRRAGSAWTVIETEWEKITKRNPGKDVIRKRFARLEAVAQVFKVGDAAILAAAKVKVENSIEEQIKKLNTDKWTSIANTMKEDGADAYKPAAIEKKFESMMKNGEIGASGEYVGPEVNGVASTPENASVDGGDDTEMKDAADAKAEKDDADEVEA